MRARLSSPALTHVVVCLVVGLSPPQPSAQDLCPWLLTALAAGIVSSGVVVWYAARRGRYPPTPIGANESCGSFGALTCISSMDVLSNHR